MHSTRNGSSRTERRRGLVTPRRNRFFHGKMMDTYHFEMETAYGITMRRQLNRLVVGEGVVCGLDIISGHDSCMISVTPGLAIDGWGREIIVPTESAPIPIPVGLIDRVCGRKDDNLGNGNGYGDGTNGNGKNGTGEPVYPAESNENGERDAQSPEPRVDDGHRYQRPERDEPRENACVTVELCYLECESDPVAVLAGECGSTDPCTPGAIREQYRVTFVPGCVDPVEVSCRFPDVLTSGEIDYGELTKWVTRGCPDPPRNACIPLANITLNCREDQCDIRDIDITIRPIVFGNAILFDMLTRIVEEEQSGESWRR